LAQELSHPFSLSFALYCAAIFHAFRQEGQAAQEQTEALITLSREQGFALRAAAGTVLRGWALAAQGQGEEGIAQVHQGVATWRATGAEQRVPSFFALLADAYQRVGRALEGLSVLTEALPLMERNGEHFIEAELYRLKGELTLQKFKV
jgi:predicted ATPase